MKTIKVAAAVIRDDNKIFATARGYGEYKGWWEFPGGKIEEGETPQQALIREIREELTAEIAVGDLIKTIEYDYPAFHLSMDCFWAEVVSGHLELKEAEDAKWLTADRLDEVKWLPADLELIAPLRHMLEKSKTLDYYERNAESFVTGTLDVRFEDTQKRFASLLPDGAYILDFGCGSGRDAKAFLDMGYRVDATDGSEKLCELASDNVGITVRKMLFSELDECDKYDGIWACASILHLSRMELKRVFRKMLRAVKTGGYIYTSFKYGEFEGYRNERYFTDFTEVSFGKFVKDITEIRIIEKWITSDVRPGRGDEKWLNVILKKWDTAMIRNRRV